LTGVNIQRKMCQDEGATVMGSERRRRRGKGREGEKRQR
jgi:hypothetical protein